MQQGSFLKRYKRFFADFIDDQGQQQVAHLPNTGSMRGLLTPHCLCRFTPATDPKRKLRYTLEMLKTETSWVGVNTQVPNKLVFSSWQDQLIPHWKRFKFAQREVKISPESRIDMVLHPGLEPGIKKITTKNFSILKESTQLHFVEIKNVTLCEPHLNGVALFPDSVTTRGQKHIIELMKLLDQGHTCEMFYVVQREDCHQFQVAQHIDPTYGELLKKAYHKGLIVTAYSCSMNKDGVQLRKPLDITWP